ncbi:hypothetical protein ACFLTE_08525 [Bacteroidota bacterium]
MKARCFVVFLIVIFSLVLVSSFSAKVNVPEVYVDVSPGEMFYFETDIKYPENPSGRVDLRLNYEVVDNEGDVIKNVKGLRAIETQVSFLESFEIPADAVEGMHVIRIIIQDYESLKEEIEASFYIVVSDMMQFKVYFFILLGAILLVGVLVSVNIFITLRKKR